MTECGKNNITEGLALLDDKNYDAELLGLGIEKDKIHHYGFAFAGKSVLIG